VVSFLAARGFPCLQHWHGPLGCGGDFLATTLSFWDSTFLSSTEKNSTCKYDFK